MGKVDDHRAALRVIDDWRPYLDANSALPGPRANLELVAACGEEADRARAGGLVAGGDEFATVCGLVAMGRLLGEGEHDLEGVLHRHAGDARWRVREGVAMALQRAADVDPGHAFAVAERWASDPDPLVRRAAVAGVCEPRLLRDPAYARRALAVVVGVTEGLSRLPQAQRRHPGVRTLRQALGYAWSVAVAAIPDEGIARFRWLEGRDDADLAWIARENRKKKRLRGLLDT